MKDASSPHGPWSCHTELWPDQLNERARAVQDDAVSVDTYCKGGVVLLHAGAL